MQCPWLIETFDPEAGEVGTRECGANAEEIYGGRGWRCAAGHEHSPLEIELAPFGPAWQREQKDR